MTSRTIRYALGVTALALAAALPASAQSVETRGVVQRVDAAAGIVYFTDGRTVRLEPGSRLTVDGRVVSLADVQPGWTLVVPGVAATQSPSVIVAAPAPPPAPRTPRTPVDVTGVVSRIDPATGTIVLEDGRVLQTSGRTTIWQPVGVRELKPGASIYMRNADPVDYRPATTPPTGSPQFQEGGTKASFAGGRTIGQIIDDAAIVTEVKAKLTAEKLSNLTRIDVRSDAGVVTLAGTVDSAERRARAVQIASSVNGVKTVLNNIEVTGNAGTASTPSTGAGTSATASTAPAATPMVEVTGTVASVDAANHTITLQDGRVLKATDQTVVWQPTSVGALKPGAQVLLRGATPASNQAGAASGARHWRMATVSRVDRSANELVLNDGTTVKVTSRTHVHRGTERLGVEQLEPGTEVVVYTPSASATEANEVAVVWTPTASAK